MIGITFALPSESSGLRTHLRERSRDDGFVKGKIGDQAVAVLHTGVGAAHCNQRMEALLHKARPELVISSGFAGAISNDLKVSDLILSQNFSDPVLLGRAKEILSDRKTQIVKLFSSPSIVDSIAERNKIARESGATAVDMETGSISGICKAHAMPLLSLRGITDTPTDPFPIPPHILFDLERQRTDYARLFAYLLRHPASLPKLTRFSKRIAEVRATITDALMALIKQL